MNKRFFLGLIASILVAGVFAACGSPATNDMSTMPHQMTTATPMLSGTPGSDPMTQSLKNISGKDFEIKFMQEMIVHHQSAIAMAKLVPTHTQRPELTALAQDIITAQTKEISDMTTWLASWHNEKPLTDAMSVPGMMDMMGQMDQLKNVKNADFDKMFLSMMIAHHQQAVSMATLLPGKTQRTELLQLGQNIVQTQNAEIQKMQGWQKDWFKA